MFGICVAETILASVDMRTQQQAGHMDASDQIKIIAKHLASWGPSTYGIWAVEPVIAAAQDAYSERIQW
ncbi:hypothetical protein J2Z75_005806 [Rhizobium herbae]|uniref:Uncharacterized protein n=1 Tax=Rhizobium herbae TaxID=508661 RepID=A0ABS4EWD2_9HYPH|nr:hypothetical protein [Rhizobium herbae]